MDVAGSDLLTVALLVALEAMLSADNALVMAVMVLGLPRRQHKKALRYGLVGGFDANHRHAASGLSDSNRVGEAGRRTVPPVPDLLTFLRSPGRRRRSAHAAAGQTDVRLIAALGDH